MSLLDSLSNLLDEHWNTEAAIAIDSGIDDAVHQHRAIDQTTARLIAACIATSSERALGRFVQNGRLDRQAAIRELDELEIDEEHEPWAAALYDYLDQPRLLRAQRAKPENKEAA